MLTNKAEAQLSSLSPYPHLYHHTQTKIFIPTPRGSSPAVPDTASTPGHQHHGGSESETQVSKTPPSASPCPNPTAPSSFLLPLAQDAPSTKDLTRDPQQGPCQEPSPHTTRTPPKHPALPLSTWGPPFLWDQSTPMKHSWDKRSRQLSPRTRHPSPPHPYLPLDQLGSSSPPRHSTGSGNLGPRLVCCLVPLLPARPRSLGSPPLPRGTWDSSGGPKIGSGGVKSARRKGWGRKEGGKGETRWEGRLFLPAPRVFCPSSLPASRSFPPAVPCCPRSPQLSARASTEIKAAQPF